MGDTISSLQTYSFPGGSNGSYPAAKDVNLDHDFVTTSDQVFHQTEGLLDPLQLLVPDDQAFISDGGYQLRLTRISERDPVTNFPTLVGFVWNNDPNSVLVVLTPHLVNP